MTQNEYNDLSFFSNTIASKANAGDPYAVMYMADAYLNGWGIQKNNEQYSYYLNAAASMGVSNACIRLFVYNLASGNIQEAEKVLQQWDESSLDEFKSSKDI